ncbi:hypothetical protein F5884DRAFT_825906 [Xylogone sp. PMI_703]|nr:hypothetical protein F5884DRAFT_825906 [Xylogone sp. PMI_703]
MDWETTDVLICGCGPTGAMLSGYLGQLSVPNVVLEKEPAITTDPRGIALDEEGIRLVQGLGIYDHIYKDIGTCMYQFQFVGGRKHELSRKPSMLMDYTTTEGGTGHVGFICHKQPSLEKYLREAMASTPFSELRSSCTVTNISEDEDWVYCHYRAADGTGRQIRSKFLVGADGKTGYTRKNYLEPKGIRMERASNMTYEETWVALNWKITLPTEKTHPDFPLWKLGYSPEDVYDLFFPSNFRFLCNPDRPSVCGRFGLPSDRLWRFEFVVLKDENGDVMASPSMIKKVVFPYLRHKGSRYGLRDDVAYPEDCIEVLRCRPFSFSARSCNRWAEGRVILCGDAAHVFPPFGGQGIASGFRDAVSLAWRLAFAARLPSSDRATIEKIFTAWYMERKQQLERSLASTIENGNFVTEGDPVKIFFRDCYLWLVQLIPSWKHNLHLGNRREGMVRYHHQLGMPFIQEMNGGVCLPQVYCRRLDQKDNSIFFSDSIIWRKEATGLFKIVVLGQKFEDVMSSIPLLDDIERISGGHIQKSDITVILEDLSFKLLDKKPDENWADKTYQVASGEEFSASPLCRGRPEPQGYDAYRLGKEVKRKRFIFLRPDRFVYAACDSREEIERVAGQVQELLKGYVSLPTG